jgi:hypothetical protein
VAWSPDHATARQEVDTMFLNPPKTRIDWTKVIEQAGWLLLVLLAVAALFMGFVPSVR